MPKRFGLLVTFFVSLITVAHAFGVFSSSSYASSLTNYPSTFFGNNHSNNGWSFGKDPTTGLPSPYRNVYWLDYTDNLGVKYQATWTIVGLTGPDSVGNYTLSTRVTNRNTNGANQDLKKMSFKFIGAGCVSDEDSPLSKIANCYSATAQNRQEQFFTVTLDPGEIKDIIFNYNVTNSGVGSEDRFKWCSAMQMDIELISYKVENASWQNVSSVGVYGLGTALNSSDFWVDECMPSIISGSKQIKQTDGTYKPTVDWEFNIYKGTSTTPLGSATSGQDGIFRGVGIILDLGEYRVEEVVKPGYILESPASGSVVTVTKKRGESYNAGVFKNAPDKIKIGDLVWIDSNGNGIYEEGIDTPTTGAVVSLYPESDSLCSGTPISTSSGNYVYFFDVNKNSVYYLKATPTLASFYPTKQNQGADDSKDSDGPGCIKVTIGEQNDFSYDFGYIRYGTLVLLKTDSKNIQLNNAVFEIESTDAPYAKTEHTVLTDGRLVINNLRLGTYIIKEKTAPQGYNPATVMQTVVFNRSNQSKEVTFINTPSLGSISGRKINDINGNGDLDTGEVGLSNWVIGCYTKLSPDDSWRGCGINGGVPQTTTNALGEYRFEGLLAGDYKIVEILSTGWSAVYPVLSGGYVLTLTPGQVVQNKNFYNRQIAIASCSSVTVNPTSNQTSGNKGYYQLITTYTMDSSKTLEKVTFTVTKEGGTPTNLECSSTTGNCIVDTANKRVTYNNFLISSKGSYKFEASVTEN